MICVSPGPSFNREKDGKGQPIVFPLACDDMAMGQNCGTLVNIKIAGKWVFIPLILIMIGFDTHPYDNRKKEIVGRIPRNSMNLS